MPKAHSKRYASALKVADLTKDYPLKDAVDILAKFPKAKLYPWSSGCLRTANQWLCDRSFVTARVLCTALNFWGFQTNNRPRFMPIVRAVRPRPRGLITVVPPGGYLRR